MNELHQRLLRALVAAQVAVLEHADEDINEREAIKGLEQATKTIVLLVKALKRSE